MGKNYAFCPRQKRGSCGVARGVMPAIATIFRWHGQRLATRPATVIPTT
ncbi:hypothetical protein KCP74_20995 [Salmonella enterica subsp. enterica]|nr:hypothetical protein KCP74_20995 [Salmonella enterica subsp. enterica]